MKLAVVASAGARSGGAYNYEMTMLERLVGSNDLDIVIMAPRRSHKHLRNCFPNTPIRSYNMGIVAMVGLWLRSSFVGYALLHLLRIRHSRLEKTAIRLKCDVVYYLAPNPLALGMVDLPMISTVWDIGHRRIPEYPEIAGSRHYEERERFYSSVLPKSVRVVVDSFQTRDDIVRFYGVDPARVILGGMPVDISAGDQDIISKIDVAGIVKGNYIIYPAQFWPHKRHVLLLHAFHKVIQRHSDFQLVLTGADKGNLRHIYELVSQLNLRENVVITGFIDHYEVLALIKRANLMVFPSDLGPTNIPPLEAVLLGTRVLISNVHDMEIHSHPLVTVVEEQTIESWAESITSALSRESISGHSGTTPPGHDLTEDVVTELTRFAAVLDEWVRSSYARIDDE